MVKITHRCRITWLNFFTFSFTIYNSGLFSDVLNYVLRNSKSSNISQLSAGEGGDEVKSKPFKRKKLSVPHRDSEGSTDIATVCVQCFKFLKALAKDYTEVQER